VYVGDGPPNNRVVRYTRGPFVVSIDVVVTGPVRAGEPFTVTATAHDENGATADYSGPASWSSLDGVLTPAAPADFVHGVSTTTTTEIAAPFHRDKITVTGSGVTGQSALFDVLGPFAKVAVAVPGWVSVSVPFTVTANATDAAGNLLSDYDGPATWSDLSGALSPAAPADFVNGMSTTQATVASGFDDDTITVSSGGVTGTSNLFRVFAPASLDVVFTDPEPFRVGVPFTVTVVARNAVGHQLGAYQGFAAWSDLSGSISPAQPARFVNGVSVTRATVAVAFHSDQLTVTSGGVGDRSGRFHVFGPVVSIGVAVERGSGAAVFAKVKGSRRMALDAGVPFTVRARAYDAAHTVLVGYDGPASWSSVDGILTPATPSPFVNGVSTTQAMIPTAFRDDRITLTSGGVSGLSTKFVVLGGLAKIIVRVHGPVSHGVPFKVDAQALDSLGTSYVTLNGTPAWSSLAGGLTPVTPASFIRGTSITMATINTASPNNRITVTYGGITGNSSTFNVG
jgi:hypothetical protein